MGGFNWRAGDQVPIPQAGNSAQPVDGDDWRRQLPHDARERIVNKITQTLTKHLPPFYGHGPEALQELTKIAVRFEERMYSAATSQSDYLRNISLKMLTMEMTSKNPMAANSLQPHAAGSAGRNPSDQGISICRKDSSSHLAGSSASLDAIPITNSNAGHLEAPNAAGSSDLLPLSISIGDSEILSASLSSQPNTHVIHLEAPNPARSSAKPIAISITISIP